MQPTNWKKILAYTDEEVDALSKISKHQKNIQTLLDCDGRVYIDGEDVSAKILARCYLEAMDNICSPAVLDMLISMTDTLRSELINAVFLDMAVDQQKKTRFLSELKRLEKQAKSAAYVPAGEAVSLSQYTVEDKLSELELRAKMNLVTKRIEIDGLGSQSLYELYSRSNILNVLPSLLLDEFRRDGVKHLGQGTKQIEQYLFNIADANRFNPIIEMLEAHENDDAGNLDVLAAILGIEDEFDLNLVKKWMIQCAALAHNGLEKPVSAEGVLVLQGEQGCGKTTFFRRLALKAEWFTEGAVIDVKNKDSVISALSTWICELGEIDCTLQREQSALKAFITRPLDRIRFPYAAAESELARTTSLCGTVNPDKFLNDLTGARRYWVVKVKKIAVRDFIAMDDELIMNIWGYFYHLYKLDKNAFRLSDGERAELEKRNRAYNCELKFEAEVMDLMDFSLPRDMWSEVNTAKLGRFMGNVSAVQIGRVLTKMVNDGNGEIAKSNGVKKYLVPLSKTLLGLDRVR